jgi:hypothetical protein
VALVRILSPESNAEIAAVVAMFEAHEIPCFVRGGGFGGLFPGPQINAYNTRDIMVPEETVSTALELLVAYHSPSPTDDVEVGPRRTSGKLRNLFELLFFGWFIPGSASKGRAVVKVAAGALLIVVLVCSAYVGWLSWQMRRVQLFCEDLHPGMARSAIDQVGEEYGIDKRWLDQDGTFDENTKDWVLLVRPTSRVGNFACAIHYKGGVVVATEVWGP